MPERCLACGLPVDDGSVWLRATWHGFTVSRLNGAEVSFHGRCFRLVYPDAEPLPERVSEPIVGVEWEPQGWTAVCKAHGEIALKDTREDAELSAAYHLARVHVGAIAPDRK